MKIHEYLTVRMYSTSVVSRVTLSLFKGNNNGSRTSLRRSPFVNTTTGKFVGIDLGVSVALKVLANDATKKIDARCHM